MMRHTSLAVPVSERDHSQGPATAAVTLVQYGGSSSKEMNSMASLAFVLSLKAGKAEEWRAWIREIQGPCRSEYEAFSRKLSLKTQRAYLQHTPQGDQAIMYLEGNDLQHTFLELQTPQDPFTAWLRQRTQDLSEGSIWRRPHLDRYPNTSLMGPALKRMKRVTTPLRRWNDSVRSVHKVRRADCPGA